VQRACVAGGNVAAGSRGCPRVGEAVLRDEPSAVRVAPPTCDNHRSIRRAAQKDVQMVPCLSGFCVCACMTHPSHAHTYPGSVHWQCHTHTPAVTIPRSQVPRCMLQ